MMLRSGSGAWNRTTIQGFKEREDGARADATDEIMLDCEAGARAKEQDGPPEDAEMGHATDPVGLALAEALSQAATAEQWDVVGRLANELEARRRARL
jgi:hypothetical protein